MLEQEEKNSTGDCSKIMYGMIRREQFWLGKKKRRTWVRKEKTRRVKKAGLLSKIAKIWDIEKNNEKEKRYFI